MKKIINIINKNEVFLALLLFTFTFAIYIYNLSPSVYGGDSGDLITAAIARGVPHPSGYPLHTMLGILFLKLPLQATPAWKVGLISSMFSAITVVITYKLVYQITKKKSSFFAFKPHSCIFLHLLAIC